MGYELLLALQFLQFMMTGQPGAPAHAQMKQAAAQLTQRSAAPQMTIEAANRAATYRAAWAVSKLG